MTQRFRKILVANRGEIAIRVFRACTELGIRTVAIYSDEDRLHLHRYKADEAYLVGQNDTPVGAYLNPRAIVELALEKEVDAIHPGYGFLSENAAFAKACADAGVVFIGPEASTIERMGDKLAARALAIDAEVPVIPGTDEPVGDPAAARAFAEAHGFPLIVKAAHGGGGRGMTVVRSVEELERAVERGQAEAQAAFGNPAVFLERYLEGPKHIEVQILGDQHGNLVHLFERDCTIQRRHQKIVEIAPSLTLSPTQREALFEDALKIGRSVDYTGAGTVEFLVDREGHHYFIEVNPRIQVEHTVTEMITARDLVECQIRIAEGHALDSDAIRIPSQAAIEARGVAMQLRITAEDPANDFAPDTGQITAYRSAQGPGIRLDGGSGFEGAVISPHYDSLLVKVCAHALDFDRAVAKALRSIREFRIRGVKTNIPFLENLLEHPRFLSGEFDTGFIDSTPELFRFRPRRDRANKLLAYLGELIVNGFPGISPAQAREWRESPPLEPPVPAVPAAPPPPTVAFQVYQEQGPQGLSRWLLEQGPLQVTDTTFRDAHQSLLATRVRSADLLRIAHQTGHLGHGVFSHEVWGGATFDVALRFLHEDPWARLALLRAQLPGTLLQMLVRSGNAVGYTNYPDNVVRHFIERAAAGGVDLFRVFDCFNWVEGLKPTLAMVVESGKIAEAAICYTGDITDSRRVKYNLAYYLHRARELEQAGAHILGIKDMAGLLKPEAARILVTELKNVLTIPVHLHTHDTSGNGIATLLEAARAGVDAVDAALSSMSGVTSQPSLNALVTALAGTERDTGLDYHRLQQLADYWEVARHPYAPFESGLKTGTADVYHHEIPGGQYSNFRAQAVSLGLGPRWEEVKHAYRVVNDMLGDIVKVTPSSKAVGDMALFMVQNDLTPEDVLTKGSDLAFPDSFVSMLAGMMGQTDGGFPKALQRAVLGDREPITRRPGDLLEAYDFEAAREQVTALRAREPREDDLSSLALYPEVFAAFCRFEHEFGDVSVLDTPTFLYGLQIGEEKAVTIEAGKTLIVKLLAVGELEADGTRQIFFELNGRRRDVVVPDRNSGIEAAVQERADPANADHVGAPMSGQVAEIYVSEGDTVEEGQRLLATEAMKMLNVVPAPHAGTVKRLLARPGATVLAGDLLCEIG